MRNEVATSAQAADIHVRHPRARVITWLRMLVVVCVSDTKARKSANCADG